MSCIIVGKASEDNTVNINSFNTQCSKYDSY